MAELIKPELVEERVAIAKYGKKIVGWDFKFPDGRVEEFLCWGGKTVPAIIFPFTKGKEVVALKQFRFAGNEFVIEIPGGNPEHLGEGTEEAGRREFEEETGYTAENFIRLGGPPVWFDPASCFTPFVPILALGCQKTKEPKLDKREIAEVVVIPLGEWIKMIEDGRIHDSKTITITFLALQRLNLISFRF